MPNAKFFLFIALLICFFDFYCQSSSVRIGKIASRPIQLARNVVWICLFISSISLCMYGSLSAVALSFVLMGLSGYVLGVLLSDEDYTYSIQYKATQKEEE